MAVAEVFPVVMMMLKSARNTSVFAGVAAALSARSATSPWERACCASRQKVAPGAGLSKEY
eukprot:5100871-Prymnesium_polylepis.1